MVDSTTFGIEIELGMQHLGRHNLNESAFFKAMGAHRWKHLENLGGRRSAGIVSEAGERLYPTFFFVEIQSPVSHPLSAFGENESLFFEGGLCHFGKTHLDGRYVLRQNPNVWIRMSNVFIYQKAGPSKLAVAFPETVDFSRIPSLPREPETVNLCRVGKENGTFFEPNPDDIPLFEGVKEYRHVLDPDRDLNGAGLVYFANFICFLDAAERQVLRSLSNPVPGSLLDNRSTYRRIIGYFGNAEANDSLLIQLAVRAREVADADPALGRQLDFAFDYIVRRESDAKIIVVSSARKIAPIREQAEERWVREWLAQSPSVAPSVKA